ncbi:MAG: LysR family transcriptional regulator [Granulosicoccus sp.]
MEWRNVKFDWNHARAFLVTAEEGSLSAAARALGLAQPTLGRQVNALEEELGVVLFDRAGGKLVLTPSGHELLEQSRFMAEAANRMSLIALGQSQQLKGTIRVSASEVYSAFLLPGILAKLRAAEPGIHIDIIASNTEVDLSRREADIAVRNFRPTQKELIAKKIRDDSGRLYASKAYLDKITLPDGSIDLQQAVFIGFADTRLIIEWLNGAGMPVTQDNFAITTESYLVHWEMVKCGLGIGVMPEMIGDKETTLRRAFPDLAPFIFPIWLVSHRELKSSRRVRIVFDLLAKELSC